MKGTSEEIGSNDDDIRFSGLPHFSVWAFVLMTVVTLGFYTPYWWLKRLEAFHSLDTNQQLPPQSIFIGAAAALMASWVLIFAAPATGVDIVLDLAVGIFYVYVALRGKGILQDHLAAKGVREIEFNGLWTFLFQHWYLQYKINQIHDRGVPLQPASQRTFQEDFAPELRELAKLHEEGILTDEEYERRRNQLVDQL